MKSSENLQDPKASTRQLKGTLNLLQLNMNFNDYIHLYNVHNGEKY